LQIGTGLDALDHLLAGEALGQRHLVGDRLTLDESVEHLAHARGFAEFVLASLQRAGAAQIHKVDDARHEHAAVGDDLVTLKPLGNSAHALPLRNHHHGGSRQRTRPIELEPEERE